MKYGIAHLGIAPLRKTANDTAEMVSQLLFGETVKVLAEKKQWIFVECLHDGYQGWMDVKQIMPISEKDFFQLLAAPPKLTAELVNTITIKDERFLIPMGSFLHQFDGMTARVGKVKQLYSGQSLGTDSVQNIEIFTRLINKYKSAPYLWGGRTPLGIDCSGFTQMLFRFVNIALPRDAKDQVLEGEIVNLISEAQIGDLAFFGPKKDKITHVGVISSEGKITHAHGMVRTDKIDQQGIYNEDVKKYTHKLRYIKRYFEFV